MTNDEVKTPDKADPSTAVEYFWRQGKLRFLLDSNQQELYDIYYKTKRKILVWKLSRGAGKSFLLFVIALETGFAKPNSVIKYGCSTKDQARKIVDQIAKEVLETCPEDIKPVYKTNEHAYRFHNGSTIQLEGLNDGDAEKLRGGSASLAIADEAADVHGSKKDGDLKYIVRSIFMMAVTRSKRINGKVILASTPPKDESHPFNEYVKKAEYEGTLIVKTIYDVPRYTPEMIEQLAYDMGGYDSEDFRRECLCQIVRSKETTVIPEFTDELSKEIVKEWIRPPHFHSYVSMDIGGRDFTAILFAYYDFRVSKLIIEDELIFIGKDNGSDKISSMVKLKEGSLFTNPLTAEFQPPYKRVADNNNLIFLNDLYNIYNLLFEPTRKDDKDAVIKNLRVLIASGKIIINPRCTTLIRHLKDGRWDKDKKQFTRSVDKGHFDALSALCYLVRNVDFNANPYPAGYGGSFGDNPWLKAKNQNNNNFAIKKMLNLKPRKL